jgi:hypothetical protein
MTASCVPQRPGASPTGSRSEYGMPTPGGTRGRMKTPAVHRYPRTDSGGLGPEAPNGGQGEVAGIPCVPSSPCARRAALRAVARDVWTKSLNAQAMQPHRRADCPPPARRGGSSSGQNMKPGQIMKLGQIMILGQAMKPGQSIKRVLIGISVSGVTAPAGIGRERRFTAARCARSAPALRPLRRGLRVSAERLGAHTDTSTIPTEPLGCWNFGFTWWKPRTQERVLGRAGVYPQRTRGAPAWGRSA